jgi:hypothetical protein
MYQLKLYMWESADDDFDHITGGFSYRADLYTEAFIDNFAERFLTICEEVGLTPFASLVLLLLLKPYLM